MAVTTTLNDSDWLEPPYYDGDAVYECRLCGSSICVDEPYYEFDGKIYCELCVEDNFRHYA